MPGLQSFAAARDDAWDNLNAAAYQCCAQLLNSEGCPTLPYDTHIPHLQAAGAEAVAIAGRPIGLGTLRAQAAPLTADIALFSVESQTTNLGVPLRAALRQAPYPVATMLAGDAQRVHLFLAIRPRRRVLDQYDIDDTSLTGATTWPCYGAAQTTASPFTT